MEQSITLLTVHNTACVTYKHYKVMKVIRIPLYYDAHNSGSWCQRNEYRLYANIYADRKIN